MSDSSESKQPEQPIIQEESKPASLFDSVTNTLGITSSTNEPKEPDATNSQVISNEEQKITEEPETTNSQVISNEEQKITEEPNTTEEVKNTSSEVVPEEESINPGSDVSEQSIQKKPKRKTKKMYFENKKIKKLLLKIRNTEKTEEELLKEMESIVNKKIEHEIKKQNLIIKQLEEQKEFLIGKIKKSFTKKQTKSPLFKKYSIKSKKSNKNL